MTIPLHHLALACEAEGLHEQAAVYRRGNEAMLTAHDRRALRAIEMAREEAIEAAAKVCEQQARDFLDPQYATPQPIGSITERFACSECAKAIRSLIDPVCTCGEVCGEDPDCVLHGRDTEWGRDNAAIDGSRTLTKETAT